MSKRKKYNFEVRKSRTVEKQIGIHYQQPIVSDDEVKQMNIRCFLRHFVFVGNNVRNPTFRYDVESKKSATNTNQYCYSVNLLFLEEKQTKLQTTINIGVSDGDESIMFTKLSQFLKTWQFFSVSALECLLCDAIQRLQKRYTLPPSLPFPISDYVVQNIDWIPRFVVHVKFQHEVSGLSLFRKLASILFFVNICYCLTDYDESC